MRKLESIEVAFGDRRRGIRVAFLFSGWNRSEAKQVANKERAKLGSAYKYMGCN